MKPIVMPHRRRNIAQLHVASMPDVDHAYQYAIVRFRDVYSLDIAEVYYGNSIADAEGLLCVAVPIREDHTSADILNAWLRRTVHTIGPATLIDSVP